MRTRSIARLGLLLALSVLQQAKAGYADWPQWRGPGRNGLVQRSPSLVNRLSGESPLWRSESIPSGERGGRSSLVIHDGRVYGLTASAAKDGGFTELFCLDADLGTTLWRTKLDDSKSATTGSSTPCVAAGRLYVVGTGSEVHCLNTKDGSPIWSTPLPRKDAKPIASSIAVVDGVAVVCGDILIGLSAKTGHVLWQQGRVEGYESSPAVWNSPSGNRVICNARLDTHCVDPVGGKILWTVPGGGKSTPVVTQEYGGDFLVNMSGSRRSGLSAYRLTSDRPQKLWTVRAFDRAASPVVYNGHVYAIAGGSNGHGARFLCVHLDTGTVAWDEIIDFAEVSSPIVADSKLVAICGRSLWLLDASPARYSVLSQSNLQITLCTSPAMHHGRLYVRQSNSVICFDLKSQ